MLARITAYPNDELHYKALRVLLMGIRLFISQRHKRVHWVRVGCKLRNYTGSGWTEKVAPIVSAKLGTLRIFPFTSYMEYLSYNMLMLNAEWIYAKDY
jgi:hypothetical protein